MGSPDRRLALGAGGDGRLLARVAGVVLAHFRRDAANGGGAGPGPRIRIHRRYAPGIRQPQLSRLDGADRDHLRRHLLLFAAVANGVR